MTGAAGGGAMTGAAGGGAMTGAAGGGASREGIAAASGAGSGTAPCATGFRAGAGAGSGTAVLATPEPSAALRTGKAFWHFGQRTLSPLTGMRRSSTL